MLKSKRLFIINKLVALLPTSSCNKFKTMLYRWCGVQIGSNCELFSGLQILGNGELVIGDNVFIGTGCLIMVNQGSKVIFEDYSVIGTRSTIITGWHPITPEGPRIVSYEGLTSTIKIGKGAHIGTSATVLPGIQIGEMAHVCAGAVVTKDVQAYNRVGGVPARFLRNLSIID